MQQIDDFREEGTALYELLVELKDDQWELPTPFKSRTVNWVVQHLHDADRWALHSVTDPDGFRDWMQNREKYRESEPDPLEGRALMDRWFEYQQNLCDELERVDPNIRAPWFGPDMGLRMMATARQMETWSHGQDIYDLLHVKRVNTDRIRNICHIGVATYGWTFVNRKLEVPEPVPYVRLSAPSGAVWTWNHSSDDHFVAGSAVEFAHVVTQGRNIKEVNLDLRGDSAIRWMEIAQCFAGPPETPPIPGIRGW